ncbi:MAG TPA: aspartyl protease family protein [Chitinophagaceae bacterium]|nr:aspartyl protease family protein [Chitinophagaceae bacterium]
MRTKLHRLPYVASCCIILLILLAKPFVLTAQEEFVEPPAKYITTLPFTVLTGGVVIVKAKLDDFKDTLNFVFDTGSGGISLDSTTSADLHLKEVLSDKIVRGIAGIKNVSFTYGHTLHFPGLDVKNLDFHINDYDLLTSAYGLRIDGIMGYSFLRRYIVMMDYDTASMKIFSPGRLKYPRGGYILKPQFSTLPMQPLTIRDNTTVNDRFYFDTGAGLCMLLNDDMVQDSSLFKRKRKMYPTQAEGLGGKKQVYLSVLKEVRLGPYRFRNIPVYIFHDEFNVTMYPTLGGLIGNDILRRFNVTLNYPAQEIYIKPNRHYTDSFDYSYTGMSMYLIDGAITVQDIVHKSPADEAGFKEGDIVMAIENNVSNNIQIYKALLQGPGNRVRVLIIRKGEPKILYLRIKSIW